MSPRSVPIFARGTLIVADATVMAATLLNQSIRSSGLSDTNKVRIPSFAKVLLIDGESLSQSDVVEMTENEQGLYILCRWKQGSRWHE